jgi:hypothetical protein
VDRPHRPAPGRDPELLPVRRAAELLSRSTCRPQGRDPKRDLHRFASLIQLHAGALVQVIIRPGCKEPADAEAARIDQTDPSISVALIDGGRLA